MKVGYIVSEYPKVSHTFIRREIAAVEACGIEVVRMSIRDGGPLVDPLDQAEHARTRYILGHGVARLFKAGLSVLLREPRRTWSAFVLASRMARGAERPLPYHWIYLLEAAVVAGWVRETGMTHLHAHFGSNPAEVAMLAARLAGITYSFTAHGTVETDNAEAIGLGTKIRQARFVVAVSDYGRAQMMRRAPADRWQDIHVVRCGLGADFLEASPAPAPPQAGFLAIGRLSEEKGHLSLVEAFAQLLATGARARLVLAGDGPLRATIESRCRTLGIAEHVHITGWVSSEQVRQLLTEARALVLPSYAEGLPVVLMEALALGRPVVATWVAGIPELVEPGVSGWLVPPGHAARLGQAMRDCLDAPAEQLAAMGRAGQAVVRRQHDVRTEGAALAVLFRARAVGDPSEG
ncbi:MAG: glycosyltransferase [Burkholderiaceae bacterium]